MLALWDQPRYRHELLVLRCPVPDWPWTDHIVKVLSGINPCWADFDEIDEDALDMMSGYERGDVTFAELVSLVGREQAEEARRQIYGTSGDEDLFDNPEEL